MLHHHPPFSLYVYVNFEGDQLLAGLRVEGVLRFGSGAGLWVGLPLLCKRVLHVRFAEILIEPQNKFFDFFPTCVGKSLVLADPREPAFCQNAQRAKIVFCGTGVQGTYLDVIQKG